MCFAALGLSLSGCDGDVSKQGMCEKAVKGTLLNPETAEFFDYREVAPQTYLDQFGGEEAKLLADNAQVRPAKDSAQKTFDMLLEMSPELKIAQMRVRADGQLGNRITTKQMCFLTKEMCICNDEATFGG
jgi:hypothetical protein